MAFDIDEAIRVFRDFEKFMQAQDEQQWAGIMADCRIKMTASAENYAQAVGVFLECVDRMWGGPMGGGLFEFSDDPRWRAERQDAAGGFHVLCKRLSELRKAARKTEEDHEN